MKSPPATPPLAPPPPKSSAPPASPSNSNAPPIKIRRLHGTEYRLQPEPSTGEHMRNPIPLLAAALLLASLASARAADAGPDDPLATLRKGHPRLILTPERLAE